MLPWRRSLSCAPSPFLWHQFVFPNNSNRIQKLWMEDRKAQVLTNATVVQDNASLFSYEIIARLAAPPSWWEFLGGNFTTLCLLCIKLWGLLSSTDPQSWTSSFQLLMTHVYCNLNFLYALSAGCLKMFETFLFPPFCHWTSLDSMIWCSLQLHQVHLWSQSFPFHPFVLLPLASGLLFSLSALYLYINCLRVSPVCLKTFKCRETASGWLSVQFQGSRAASKGLSARGCSLYKLEPALVLAKSRTHLLKVFACRPCRRLLVCGVLWPCWDWASHWPNLRLQIPRVQAPTCFQHGLARCKLIRRIMKLI